MKERQIERVQKRVLALEQSVKGGKSSGEQKNSLSRVKKTLQVLRRHLLSLKNLYAELKRKRRDLERAYRRHRKNYRLFRAAYRKLSSKFHRYYRPWKLSSARACELLFKLLLEWKRWEEEVEPPPKDDRKIELSDLISSDNRIVLKEKATQSPEREKGDSADFFNFKSLIGGEGALGEQSDGDAGVLPELPSLPLPPSVEERER